MSNLKKDIEKILKDFVLWRTKIIDGKPVATYDKNMAIVTGKQIGRAHV